MEWSSMDNTIRAPWKVSLHGGHTGEFCDHAHGTLREIVEAAVAFGYHTYGLAEHVARTEARFLYPEELEMGWDIVKIQRDFEAYAHAARQLATEFADRIEIFCGFEADNIPATGYVELTRDFRERYAFDYIVASNHYVDEILIDGHESSFARALDKYGALEPLVLRYYESLAEMVTALKPEVVGHFDVIRKRALPYGDCDTPAIRRAAESALEAVRGAGCILDLNTAAYRKGLGTPFPAPWVVLKAHAMGIPFCFGDDSHAPDQVGAGVARAREYLL
ncbi:MAG: histidinol-phosphatase family, partial [Candidatus Hydrogenedentes bacterium]|nr:histidinol-phosphatase family [Candidatus Hydrogenedentota bacterium]